MTSFRESAMRTVRAVEKQQNGWMVTFIDGSCRLVNKNEKKGSTQIVPGIVIESCRTRCNGADEFGNCSMRPLGRPSLDFQMPTIKCEKQFVYARKPMNFGTEKPRFNRNLQILSYRIASHRTAKRQLLTEPEQWIVTFENGETKTIAKSDVLGWHKLINGYHLVPCGEECNHRNGKCSHCFGDKRGTECAQQFYFCRKFLKRHQFDKRNKSK